MHPLRISLITYNIWAEHRWDFRKNALRKFLELFDPDVLSLQELRPVSRDMIDATLHGHRRVHDDFSGWSGQSNIYWRDSLFSEIEHGAEDVGIEYEGNRRLFWVRLQATSTDRSILVATAHLTHQRHPDESATGFSPRVGQTRRIVEQLQRLALDREPVFFMGDLNDPVHPPDVLDQAGYVSCFAALGVQPALTFKAYPTAGSAPRALSFNQCVDWLVANAHARPVSASTPQFFFEDAAPSDHWPVHAVYEVSESRRRQAD
jgi:endonuclease/exonuclease/phosphatase family metal-dependent hydrolase